MENSLIQNPSPFKNLPKNWKVLTFVNVIDDVTGGNLKTQKSEFLEKGLIPIIDQGKDLIAGYVDNEKATVKTKIPHIVFGDHTRSLKYIDFPFAMGADGTKVLKVKSNIEAIEKYIYYFFQTLNIPETGYNRHFKYLKECLIPLPNLPTQQKIATILDKADELRQYNKQLIEKYDALMQSLFLDMFGDIKSNSKGWKITIFENIISLKRGYDLPHNSRIKRNIPVVASTGIVGYHNVSKVKTACIVTGRSGSIGKVQLINEDCWPLNTSLYGYKTFDNNLIYLKFFIEHFNIERFSHGAGVPTLDRKLVHSEIAPIPPITLQNQFAERIQLIEIQKQQTQEALAKSEDLFQGLLQRAFKGEIN